MSTEGKIKEFEYKAEMKQLLNLIIHSLYTHPKIFLRELVSNSSDALNKLRFRRLTDHSIYEPDKELNIRIEIDKDKGSFSIEDSGIGMTKKDLTDRIGTVASSGTLEFLKNLKESNQSIDSNMIGKFGVGFYSVFMVTDEITIETQSADEDSPSLKWQSKGEDKYTIEEIEKRGRGTKISFTLKEEQKEYASADRVKNILKKYSNFVDFPIIVNGEESNKVSALWHRKKEDISDEELNEFYKFVSNDYQEPLGHLQLAIEGNINFKALLFIPQTAPTQMFRELSDKTLQLYSSKVFIQDDCKDILPDYLKFVKGVVDTEDLPLNVSRELTQNSPVMAKIKNVLTARILGLLEEWAEKDKEKYDKFHQQFSSLFKTGVNSDYANRDKVINLLRFETSSLEKGKTKSLKDYVATMQSEQKEIYYILGTHRDLIEKSPNLEYFRKHGIEVLYLSDPVDFFTIPYIFEYDGKPLKSIEKADVELNDVSTESGEKLSENESKSLIDKFKEVLGDKVEDVIESKRLVESAATLVSGKQGMDPQTEKLMQMLDKDFAGGKRILEINPGHKLIRNLSLIINKPESDQMTNDVIHQIYEGALLIEGSLLTPNDFVKRMTELLVKATE